MNKTKKQKTYTQYIRFKLLFIFGVGLLAIAVALFDISYGASGMSIWDVIKTIFGQGTEKMNSIVWSIRLPRVVTALVAGLGLSIVGCVLQSVLRNPLADASTLGVSQGAAFGASFSVVILGSASMASGAAVTVSNPYTISICAFIGSIIPTAVVIGLSRIKKVKRESMILTGVALSTLFAGGTAIVQYFADSAQRGTIVYWTFGSLSSTTWREVLVMTIVVACVSVFFCINRWNYNALLGGETTAKGLGVNTERLIVISMILCSLTASVITSFIGILNFIGLIAPHLMRRVIGNDYRFLLPASACAGSALLLLSDVFSRVVLPPQVLPIGAITPFVGAPIFIYLIYTGGKRK